MKTRSRPRQPGRTGPPAGRAVARGFDALRSLKERRPAVKFVLLRVHPDATYLSRALEAGAASHVLKQSASNELITALCAALRGEVFVPPELKHPSVVERLDETKRILKPVIELTPRQRQALQLLAKGKSAEEIGALLEISARAVETHKHKMMDDLGVKTTPELVRHAIRLGLVALDR